MDDIASLYQTYLGRAPDQAGLDYWNGVLKNGGSLSDITSNFQKSAATEMANTTGHAAAVQSNPLAVKLPTTTAPAVTTPAASTTGANGNTTLSDADWMKQYQAQFGAPSTAPASTYTPYVGKDSQGNALTGWGLAADQQKYSTNGGQVDGAVQNPYLSDYTNMPGYDQAAVDAARKARNDGLPGVGDFLKEAIPIMALAIAGMATGGAALGAAGGAGSAGGAAAAGAAAAGGAEAAGGLGALGAASIPTVAVTGAAGGAGLGAATTAGLAAGGAAGLASQAGSGSGSTNASNPSSPQVDPNIPQVVVNGNTGATGSTSLGNMLNPAAGTAGALLTADQLANPSTDLSDVNNNTNPDWNSLNPVFTPPDTSAPVVLPSDGSSAVPITTPGGIGSVTNPNPSTGTSLPSVPSIPNLGSIISGIGTIAGGVTDYQMNKADKDYYQGLMDKMMGMYMPGTSEATLMENKMRAQDAAAGRNSQYGIRADNLAAMLADNRMKIMTSPTFEKLAEASRGHYDSSLSSLSSMLGSAGTSGTGLNSLINSVGSSLANSSLGSSLSDWFKAATAPER